MKKVLLMNNTHVIGNRPNSYSNQLFYLCRMFKEYGYTIYNLVHLYDLNNGAEFTKLYSYTEFKQLLDETYVDKPEDELLKDIWFLSYQNKSLAVDTDHINSIVDQNKIDIIFLLGDVHVVNARDLLDKTQKTKRFNVPSFVWFPCHSYPCTEFDLNGLSAFNSIICLSPSIKLLLEKQFPDKAVTYLPHVIDIIYTSTSKGDLRDKWHLPKDKYIVLVIANISTEDNNRKCIDTILTSFKQFKDKYVNTILCIHATIVSYPLQDLMDALNISSDDVFINNTVLSKDEIAELYTLSDTYICCSKTEGFGIPILESQLYGTNVISSNFTSMAEHNFQKNVSDISTVAHHYKGNGNWTLPSTYSLFNMLEQVYLNDNKTKVNRAQWITGELTSYKNVKEQLYRIIQNVPR